VWGAPEIEAGVVEYKDWIAGEVLARVVTVGRGDEMGEHAAHAVEIDGLTVHVALTRDE
jgi:hypothetical protein